MLNIIKKFVFKIITIIYICLVTCCGYTFAESIVDKQGRVVDDITAPTKESTIDPETISEARRYVPKNSSSEKSENNGPQKNIYSESTIIQAYEGSFSEYIRSLYDEKKFSLIAQYGELTQIRHTISITDVDNDRYELINDGIRDRLKMRIFVASTGIFDAKDGFYKVGEKIYYFDKDGYMVLGPAVDSRDNHFFFSYETGELLKAN